MYDVTNGFISRKFDVRYIKKSVLLQGQGSIHGKNILLKAICCLGDKPYQRDFSQSCSKKLCCNVNTQNASVCP